jgi:hypothetical protein
MCPKFSDILKARKLRGGGGVVSRCSHYNLTELDCFYFWFRIWEYVRNPKSEFEYFLNGFAQEETQIRPAIAQDRTQRAPSDALINFFKRPFYFKEKVEILPEKSLNLPKPLLIRVDKPPDCQTFLLVKIPLNSGADFQDFLLIFAFLTGSILATFWTNKKSLEEKANF